MKSTKFISFKNAFIYNFFIKIMLHKMLSYGKRIMILSMTEGSPVFFCVFFFPHFCLVYMFSNVPLALTFDYFMQSTALRW